MGCFSVSKRRSWIEGPLLGAHQSHHDASIWRWIKSLTKDNKMLCNFSLHCLWRNNDRSTHLILGALKVRVHPSVQPAKIICLSHAVLQKKKKIKLVANINLKSKKCSLKDSDFWLLLRTSKISDVLNTRASSDASYALSPVSWCLTSFFWLRLFSYSCLLDSCFLTSWSWMHLVLRPLIKMINSFILQLYKTKYDFNLPVSRVTLNDS